MKYCLCVGLHNLFFDIAIVNNRCEIVKKYKCNFDRAKDISRNIYNAYRKYFYKYDLVGVGVGISNNIEYKDDFLYNIKSFNFDRYNLKQSLFKLFKVDICLMEETYLASLSLSYDLRSESLLYLILDNKISNSFVLNNEVIELDDDLNLRLSEELNNKCCKDTFKSYFLTNDLDDDCVGNYFVSNNEICKKIIAKWSKNLDVYLNKLIKEIRVDKIVFGGYLGEYLEYFKEYLLISKNVNCLCINNHREHTLKGVSHLIFKDI